MHYLSILFMKSMNFSLLSNNFVPQSCKSTNHVLIFTFSVLLTYFLITTYSKIIFRKYTLVVRNLWLVEKNMSKINFLRRTLKSTWNLLECSGLLGKLKKWKKKTSIDYCRKQSFARNPFIFFAWMTGWLQLFVACIQIY